MPDHRWRINWKYGITEDQYYQLLDEQERGCAICEQADGVRLSVDHSDNSDGTTNVRGLLCRECNMAIGKLHHDVELLRRAIEYLERETPFTNLTPQSPPRKPRPRTTHCKRGHEFTPENTHVRANGHRLCLACERHRYRLRQSKRDAKLNAQ